MEFSNFDLDKCLSDLSSLPAVKQNDNIKAQLSVLREKLAGKTFQLVVLGQFKRGKTSLINALFGEDLLPTAIVPLTSIITIIKYGEREKICVKFLDGREKQIEKKELSDYITEPKNPENEKKVDLVTIAIPSPYLKRGIEVIDTPGVGSIYKHNTDVSYSFVPKADAGVFVVTADPPISDSELQFLKSIKDYLAKIVFVQNKIDQVDEKDRRESMLFTQKVIEEAVGKKDLQFNQCSARLALEGQREKDNQKIEKSGIKTLRETLDRLLFGKKEDVISLSVINKLFPLANEIELQLRVMNQALEMSTNELKEKTEAFKAEALRIKKEREDNSYILRGQAERLTKEVLVADIEALSEKELPRLLQEYEVFYKEHKNLGGKEILASFDKFLEKAVKKIFTDWRKKEKQKLQNDLKVVLDRFSNQTNLSIEKIIDLSSNLFDLKLNKFQIESGLAEEIEFRFAFDEYNLDIDIYTPVVSRLPKFIASKLLYNKMKSDVLEQFDRHCGRSRFDFHERVIKGVNDYANRLDRVFERIISGIENALSEAMSQKDKNAERQSMIKAEIRKQENILKELKMKLKTLRNRINAI